MEAQIKIALTTPSFGNGRAAAELARILRELAASIESLAVADRKALTDREGNVVGTFAMLGGHFAPCLGD